MSGFREISVFPRVQIFIQGQLFLTYYACAAFNWVLSVNAEEKLTIVGFNKNKTQTAVTNICLNCIPFMNLTFRMLQHTSSEVITIQLQINLNSKIQPYGLGTNEID